MPRDIASLVAEDIMSNGESLMDKLFDNMQIKEEIYHEIDIDDLMSMPPVDVILDPKAISNSCMVCGAEVGSFNKWVIAYTDMNGTPGLFSADTLGCVMKIFRRVHPDARGIQSSVSYVSSSPSNASPKVKDSLDFNKFDKK